MRFALCSVEDLEALAAALQNGRLKIPAGDVAISRLGVGGSLEIAKDFESLFALGFGAGQAAEYLNGIAAERRAGAARDGMIELVATGPDSSHKMRDTAVVVDQLFAEAKNSVLVVGFALYDGAAIFRRLADRMDSDENLAVTLCFDISRAAGQTTKDEDIVYEFSRDFVLKQWPGKRTPKFYYYPLGLHIDRAERAVLHAKCIIIDDMKALVTSANPTPAAYGRNIELGLLMSGGKIPAQIAAHFHALIQQKSLREMSMPARTLVGPPSRH